MNARILRSIVTLALFVAVSAASAHAQSGATMDVSVPFEFHAGRQTLQAGAYRITQVSTRVLELRSDDGRTSVLVEAPLAARTAEARGAARLVFRRYGDHYFLAQVWTSARTGRELYTSDGERSLVEELEQVTGAAAKPATLAVAAK
jgi:hypothetical protein